MQEPRADRGARADRDRPGHHIESAAMSGHSKWSQIKRQKGANDAKRGAVFTKVGARDRASPRARAARDPDGNYRLRLAIEKARAVNMPADNIKRAIEQGGRRRRGASSIEEIVYEGYGPGGVAILVEAATDNRTGPRPTCAPSSPRPAASWPAPAPWPGSSSRAASSAVDARRQRPRRHRAAGHRCRGRPTWTPSPTPSRSQTDAGRPGVGAHGAWRRPA